MINVRPTHRYPAVALVEMAFPPDDCYENPNHQQRVMDTVRHEWRQKPAFRPPVVAGLPERPAHAMTDRRGPA